MADYTPPGAGTAAPAAHASSHISGGSDPFTSAQLLEAIVKRWQESGGPTTLAAGAIADGDVLSRSGTNLVGTTLAALAASLNVDFQTLDLQQQTTVATALTYTLPANTLGTDEDSLLIISTGSSGAADTARLRFGGTSLITLVIATDWILIGVLTRTGASAQVFAGMLMPAGATNPTVVDRVTSAIDLTANADVVVDYSTAADANRVNSFLYVAKLKAA